MNKDKIKELEAEKDQLLKMKHLSNEVTRQVIEEGRRRDKFANRVETEFRLGMALLIICLVLAFITA